jgi:hypothetical protein
MILGNNSWKLAPILNPKHLGNNGGKNSRKRGGKPLKMAGKPCKNGGKILEIMVERIDLGFDLGF